MITRRAFLSTLASLPIIGTFFKEDRAALAVDATESALAPARQACDWGTSRSYTAYSLVDNQGVCAQYDFDKAAWVFYRKPENDLSNITAIYSERTMSRAEWDRTHQA